MDFFTRARDFVIGMRAAADLGNVTPIKPPKSQVSIPAIRTQVEPRTSAIVRQDRLLATTDRLTARTLLDTRKTALELTRSSPDLASALSSALRTGIPEFYSITGRTIEGEYDETTTQCAQQIVRRMNFYGNAEGTYNSTLGINDLCEQLAVELKIYGGYCFELALDEAGLPIKFIPISLTTIKFYDEAGSYRMVQDIGGEEIDLNLPTIFYASIDQLQTEAYSTSDVESAIQPTLADIDFNNDLRRLLKRSIMPRLVASIDSERIKKMTPPEILADSEKFLAYKGAIVDGISSMINAANPEDAVVTYDEVEYSYLEANQNPAAIVERMQAVLNGKLASGAKTLPSIIGHGSNSTAASTEAMLYVKSVDVIRRKLQFSLSRALTVAVQILGNDGFVTFEFDPIDLRPTNELEAYYAMKQSRILELVSIGYMKDEDACIILTGSPPPKGFTPRWNTMFYGKKQDPNADPNATSQTSNMNKNEAKGTPTAPKSQKSA